MSTTTAETFDEEQDGGLVLGWHDPKKYRRSTSGSSGC